MTPENAGLPPDEERPQAEPAENPSHDLDMVPVFSETGATAELEALAVQGIMDANGIPFTVFGNASLPVTEFSVNVPKSRLADAQRALEDARQAGPLAAEEGERESEIAGYTTE